MTISIDSTQDEAARGELERLLGHADIPGVGYPLMTRDVLALLTELEHDVDEARLMRLVNDGRVPCPRRVGGKLAWTAADVLAVVGAAEALRWWKWPSRRHLAKFSEHEKLYAAARADGRLDEITSACKAQSIRELLLLLTTCDNRTVREAIRPLVQAKLEEKGVHPDE